MMLDNETKEQIVRDECLALERLVEAACLSCPSQWLRLCRNVVRRRGGIERGVLPHFCLHLTLRQAAVATLRHMSNGT